MVHKEDMENYIIYDEKTGEKDCYEEKEPIPIENHLTQKEYLGRSPLNEDTNMCEWLGVDIDIKIPPKTFALMFGPN